MLGQKIEWVIPAQDYPKVDMRVVQGKVVRIDYRQWQYVKTSDGVVNELPGGFVLLVETEREFHEVWALSCKIVREVYTKDTVVHVPMLTRKTEVSQHNG